MSEWRDSLDYIVDLVRGGASFEIIGDVPAQQATHYSVLSREGRTRVVLLPTHCGCPCHSGRSVIMHDEPCCSPIFIRHRTV